MAFVFMGTYPLDFLIHYDELVSLVEPMTNVDCKHSLIDAIITAINNVVENNGELYRKECYTRILEVMIY